MTDDTCGCCAGTTARTPGPIANRPGLPEIAYRSGTHSDFLASMLAGLSREGRPALARLRTRQPDDPSIALLDAFAVACDVLTFYSERLANESFLRTATDRVSLQELGKLVAYRLAPGVAAETWLAFSLERPTPVVVQSADPGLAAPAVPAVLTLPERLRVQSVPGPGEQPQTFETVEEVEARPEWSSLPVVDTRPHLPVRGRIDAWLVGTELGLRPGDAILFASNDLVNDRWDVRLLTEVEVDRARGVTHVRWEWGLGSIRPFNNPADAPQVFVLRKRIAVYGHNAPKWRAMGQQFRMDYSGAAEGDLPAEWPGFTALSGSTLDLDGAHPDVVRGSWVVVSREGDDFYRELYRVTGRAELSRSEFTVSGKVTRLTLAGEAHAFGDPRGVTVWAVPEPLTLTEAPDDADLTGPTLVVTGDATAMVPGRSLLLAGSSPTGEQQVEPVTVRTVAAEPGGRTRIELTASLAHDYRRTGAVVFGNAARATHGETVQEILGSGDARTPFQEFTLRQGPLTFVPADNPRGAETTLEVSVDGLRWLEQRSTYAADGHERILMTRDQPDGSVAVVFGDGVNGARLPTGSNNVRARYRKGIGAGGNLRRDQLSQPLDRPLGLKAVTNPLPATGGVDAETEDRARESIPRPVRTLGRAVSLQDYADFALAFPGIAKATAAVLPVRAGRSIVVSVATEDGEPPPDPIMRWLESAVRLAGDPHVRVEVVAVRTATFRVLLRIKVDPLRDRATVFAAVEAALRSRFGAAARPIGGAVHRSALIAEVARTPGVVAIDLDRLHRSGLSRTLQERLVAQASGVTADGRPIAAELLALVPGPLDPFLEMT